MRDHLKYLLVLVLSVVFLRLTGQNSQVLYHMNLPQNHLLNPALRPSNSVYIGLPVISGVNLNINNNFVNFSDVFMKGRADSVMTFLNSEDGIDDFISKLKRKNSIESEVTVQLFGLGFTVGKGNYLFLDINERIQSNFVIPLDLFELAIKGNEAFRGDRIELSSLRADMKAFHEIGFGFSKDLTSRLRAGIRAKILLGSVAVSVRNRSLGINVNDDYSHTIDADATVNISAPLQIKQDSEGNIEEAEFYNNFDFIRYLTGSGNKGLGIDIGATYDLTPKIIVSAAVTDIGYIRWKRDPSILKSDNQFLFSGINLTDIMDGGKTFEEAGQELLDSLGDSFRVSLSEDPFTTSLPFGMSLGGKYNVTRSFSLGVLSYSRFIGKQVREALTLSANLNLGNLFSTSLSYTASNHKWDNLGAGLAFRTGIFQFYFLSDRIPISWNRIVIDENDSSIILPASWNSFNLRLGMNLAFGNRIKKKHDKPMLICE